METTGVMGGLLSSKDLSENIDKCTLLQKYRLEKDKRLKNEEP